MLTKQGRKRLAELNYTTPNALPPTMLQLGDAFGASLSLDACRRVSHVEIRGGYWKDTGATKPTPHFIVDIDIVKPDGSSTYTLRGCNVNLTRREARDLHRDVTRKIAVFLWENKDVPPHQLIKLPSGANPDTDVTVSRVARFSDD
jgi:hypothetical protein